MTKPIVAATGKVCSVVFCNDTDANTVFLGVYTWILMRGLMVVAPRRHSVLVQAPVGYCFSGNWGASAGKSVIDPSKGWTT